MNVDVKNTIISSINWSFDINPISHYRNLDHFYKLGFRKFECAANYPLCGITQYFRYTEKIFHEWIMQSGVEDLELYIRIGAVDNYLQQNEFNLSGSFFLMLGNDYINKFGPNIRCFIIEGIHTGTKAEVSSALNFLMQYCNDRSVEIGINQSTEMNTLLNSLNKSGIKPVVFLYADQIFQSAPISNYKIQDIFIDAHEMNRYSVSQGNAYNEKFVLSNTLDLIDKYKNELSLAMKTGQVLPVQNAFSLDSIIMN
jgi:hypothetical protein